MNPIDKFTNIDTVYPTFDAKEEDILDYVWQLAMLIHPAIPKKAKGEILEGSEAMPTFKERYNNKLIKMPLTYEEYKKNKEIQPTLTGLEIDSDKFWFLLLFVWDYTQGQCFNAQEVALSPIGELNNLIKLLSQYKAAGENPLTDQIQFSKDITLSIQINGKEVQTIQHPNTIGYLLSSCEKSFQSFCDMELEDMIAMCEVPLKETNNTESNSSQIRYFTILFKSMLQPFPNGIMTTQKRRSRNNEVSYNVTLLISRLVYLTGISQNEEFYVNERTLKGYLSNKSNLANVRNRIY